MTINSYVTYVSVVDGIVVTGQLLIRDTHFWMIVLSLHVLLRRFVLLHVCKNSTTRKSCSSAGFLGSAVAEFLVGINTRTRCCRIKTNSTEYYLTKVFLFGTNGTALLSAHNFSVYKQLPRWLQLRLNFNAVETWVL